MVKEEKRRVKETQVWIITPFETPDTCLAKAAKNAGAFPVLHLGRNRAAAEEALNELAGMPEPFGVCMTGDMAWENTLPGQVSKIILPWGMKPPASVNAEIIWQVHTAGEAEEALALNAKALILKGSEGAGLCGEDSSFILFQQLISDCQNAGAEVFIQGGIGIHTAAAYIALGAAGVVLDSQAALFPECSLPQARKTVLSKLSGNEIRVCGGYRYYVFPGSNDISEPDELFSRFGAAGGDAVPLGQDIILAPDLADEYKKLKQLVRALKRAAFGHLNQARIRDWFSSGSEAAKTLGTVYPIIQGPMARVSDTPDFLRSVSEGGALPFLAMSMMTGKPAADALSRTAAVMEGKPWGAGILGFIYPKTLEEQTNLIIDAKPAFVLIAGGHPAQGKSFERAGIKVLLHAPAPGLLDMFLKEGARAFVFEGRESGGHVGPLFSAVLWEKQINRFLRMENLSKLSEMCIFFAGGIHDALSAAFVRVMSGPLSARGAKAGLLCGTAYLYTEEAVRYGAITEAYQRLLIEKGRTVLLKSGGGQETRCLPSPYTDFFLGEKERMAGEGLENGAIVQALETLNLGRLRIASKGIERRQGGLVSLPEEECLEKGLYMAGAIAALTYKTTAIAGLHTNLINNSFDLISGIAVSEPDAAPAAPSDIAVIGMACIYPGAADADEFWRNIIFGGDYVTEVPRERWSADMFFDPEAKDTDHTVSKWGGFLAKTDFNVLEFGITPQSMKMIEPVQLLCLLTAKRALEDAGFGDLSGADLDDTAVIFGADGRGELSGAYATRVMLRQINGEMPKEADEVIMRMNEDSFPGVLGNIITGRISNRLNTGGRNYTIDAACASSLAALDIAIYELNSQRAGMAVVGGADLHNGLLDFLLFSSTYALSPKGRCATFDMDADGIALSEGVGAVILKRLEDARRDGNKIYAVIKGTGGSSDGKSLGLTAPNRRGQMRALEQAYGSSGVKPSEIGLIEPHGTGTDAGDRAELRALTDLFLEYGARPGQTALGSLKSQIGHTKAAAGVGGLIKAVNCVRHGILPRTHHLKHPNGVYTKDSPFAFRTEKAGYWRGERRLAGVSGFGFGGTNFHAIVENYGAGRPEAPLKVWPSELFVFPGDTAEEAKGLMEKVKELYAVNDRLRPRDIAYSLAARQAGGPVQYAIVAGTRGGLLACIDKALEGAEDENVYRLKPVPGKVAFLFPGQGSQRVNMAADLFIVFPQMRRLLDGQPDYERMLFPCAAFTDNEKKAQDAEITDTRNAQPLMGIVDLAIAGLLRDFGVKPDMTAGHSYGELPALCFAGGFDPEDLVYLSRARAEAILAAVPGDPGRMAAVFTDINTLEGLLDGQDNVWAVNFNAPRQTAVAGTGSGMDNFLQKVKEAGVSYKELNVACAFHSPLLKGAEAGYAVFLNETRFYEPEIPVRSNTDAGLYPAEAGKIRERLAAHLANPVKFTDEIEKMYEDGASVFVEAGPGGTLSKLVSGILKNREISVIQTERNCEDGLTFFLQALGKYISTGRTINMDKLFKGRDAVMLNIDEPELHKKNGIIWSVNGQAALPENSELPSYDWTLLRPSRNNGNASVEQVMMAYLANMNAVIQDHRDAILSYLGASDIAARTGGMRRFDMPAAPDTAPAALPEGSADTAAAAAAGNEPADISSITAEQITGIIFEIVSEKTGYPIEMLNLDMDLEADLSIDSIKKMEIIGGLRSRIKLPETEGEDGLDEFLEKMIAIRKFKDIIDWIEEITRAAADGKFSADAGAGTGQPAAASEEKTEFKPADIVRMIFTKTIRPIEKKEPGRAAGKSFAVIGGGNGLAFKAAESLNEMGALVRIIENAEEITDLSDYDGIVFINSSAASNCFTVMELFRLLKLADIRKLQWGYVFSDVRVSALESAAPREGGQPGGISELPEGFAGFFNTLAYEYPDKRFCAVQFETPIDPETFAGIVAGELANASFIPEIYYNNAERFMRVPEISAVKTGGGKLPRAVLNEDSVVVVLGGAQGITRHITARLAEDVPCKYILVGRTAADAENGQYAEFDTVDEIRRRLIEREGMKNPRDIELKARRLFKSSRIGLSVAQIERAGGKAEYISADARDPEAFASVLTEIKNKYGRIDGVIHAAGIIEDKYFRYKDAESFERVYNTKTLPLLTILNRLLPDLKLLVLFSSMASAFGSIGQCDYAAGNSVFDSAARIVKQQYPKMRVLSFNWGPWIGAGMVSEPLKQEILKKGISLIELDKGKEFFVRELMYGEETNVLSIACEEKFILGHIRAIIDR